MCTKCGVVKHMKEFYQDCHSSDQKTSWCKQCFKNRYQQVKRIVKAQRDTKRREINDSITKIWNKNILMWKEYFIKKYGDHPQCSVCNKQLNWFNVDRSTAVCFDHRCGGNEPIKTTPRNFYERRPCITKHIDTWEECDFGILCVNCNSSLPTEGREEWVRNVNRYVFGNSDVTLLCINTELPPLDWEL